MEGEVKQTCQWNDCSSPANGHAVVGLSVFETRQDVHISEAPYRSQHLDLCQRHLELARLQYVHVTEYGLGECPNDPEHG